MLGLRCGDQGLGGESSGLRGLGLRVRDLFRD